MSPEVGTSAPPPVTGTTPVAGRWRGALTVGAAAVGGAVAVATVALVDPNQPGHYPTCPVLAVSGLYCPGCGALRAVHALTHGDLAGALDRNPLLVLALPLALALIAGWAWRTLAGRPRTWAAPGWLIWALLGVVLAYTVLRNLPAGAWLAP